MREVTGDRPDWFQADRKATVTEITSQLHSDMQNNIPERTTHQTLKGTGYSSRRPHWLLLLSAQKKKMSLVGTVAIGQ